MTAAFEKLCKDLEHWETDSWAPTAVLTKEILTPRVVDLGCGTGIMTMAAQTAGYSVTPFDIHNWGFPGTIIQDVTKPSPRLEQAIRGNTVLMNPPFKKSQIFVEQARNYGARKIVCFQRFDWYEGSDTLGKKRGSWWNNNRPARIWVCGDRAHCHLHSYNHSLRKSKGSQQQAFAFFVWEQGHAPAALTGHIFKSDIRPAA